MYNGFSPVKGAPGRKFM